MRSMRLRADSSLALLALQLAGELGHAAMGEVQRALRVLALLFGGQQLVAEAGQQLRRVRLRASAALRSPRAATGSRVRAASAPCLAAPERSTRTQPAPRRSPLRVMTDSPSPSCGSRRRASARVFGDMQAREQAADRQRALHLGGQRSGSEGTSRRRSDDTSAMPAFAELAERIRPALPAHRPARLRSVARARLRPRFPSPVRP